MIEDPVEPRFEGSTLVIETTSGPETFDSQFLVAALLVVVAKGDGNISVMETEMMLQLVNEHFHFHSGESLALLTRAMAELAENPDLDSLLRELGHTLNPQEKEDIAVMLLKLIAVDGIRDFNSITAISRRSTPRGCCEGRWQHLCDGNGDDVAARE